jgi:cytochrome c-type biogenesis protein
MVVGHTSRVVPMSTTAYVLAFGGGVVSFLSPCVLPLVPAYLSLTTGLGLTERRGGRGTVQALRAGGLFVAGFAVVFVALGLCWTPPAGAGPACSR